MPKKLPNSLQDYLSKIRIPSPQIQLSSSKSWILSGCKHPRTLSFAIDHKQHEARSNDDDAATLPDVDRFLFENFPTLSLRDDGDNAETGEEDREIKKSPRFNRLLMNEALTTENFRSSCSASTSTINDAASNSNNRGKNEASIPDNYIAVLTRSSSPCDDFRRSMQVIVEERLKNNGDFDWDFMEELLLCYLNLNEKKSHKQILSAFVDLIIILRKHPDGGPARCRNIQLLKLSEKAGRR